MDDKRLFESLEAVKDEHSFLQFVDLLISNREAADTLASTVDGHQGEWANQTIASFLEAASAWANASAFGERPGPKSGNPWQLFATFLWAGRGYE
jgi:hypothetical protein